MVPFPPEISEVRYRGPNVRIVITDPMTKGRTLSIPALLLALLALGAAGCGSSEEDLGGPPPDYEKALAGAPAPLAALHEQANELLPGGVDAYERRVAALQGYPVVVNVWASWCGPCRFEFPMFQDAAARYGKRVAFLGVDGEDSDDAAEAFLAEEPVPYPSYTDPDKEILSSLGGSGGFPDTAFYDENGELLYLKQGQYADHEAFEADFRRYALQQGG